MDMYQKAISFISSSESIGEIGNFLELNGFQAVPPEDDKFMEAWYKVVEGKRIVVQYRWYDTSKTFSIRPDMNVYSVKSTDTNGEISRKEIRFLDKGPY